MSNDILNNLPEADEIWKGIGGHFDSLGQIVAEFIDNSLANIIATHPSTRDIAIHFKDLNQFVQVSIEDSGGGIKNLENAFRLGGKKDKQGPLNEHGFGMKHALASANPENDNWTVLTRTSEQYASGIYKRISYPYKINKLPVYEVKIAEEPWPGKFNGSGTLIQFKCSRELFNTLRIGMPGQPSFSTCISYLVEDLGFLYAGLIADNIATFSVSWTTNDEDQVSRVPEIKPQWEKYYHPEQGYEDFDLGNGKVRIDYSFGATKDSGYKKYYRRNMSSSGLEIRINGRLLAHNLFKEVWNMERHNMYNHLLVTVNIQTDDSERLPPTRTSKNGFRQGDSRLEALFDWVRRYMPTPPKDITGAADERDLFDELLNQKKFHIPEPKTVLTEQYVFTSLGERIRIDLYLATNGKVWIYEGKKDLTTVKDVYQLKMYWDGAVLDNIQPSYGILIASEHPSSVSRMVSFINSMKDIKGNNYNFELKKWKDEGIQYPS